MLSGAGPVPWTEIAAALSVVSIVVVFLIWAARSVLRPYFVAIGAHRELVHRVANVESIARAAATNRDLREISDRVAAVERSSVANGEGIKALTDSVHRVEAMMELLYRRALRSEGDRG